MFTKPTNFIFFGSATGWDVFKRKPWVNYATFADNGTSLAVGTKEGSIAVVDTRASGSGTVWKSHEGAVGKIIFSPG